MTITIPITPSPSEYQVLPVEPRDIPELGRILFTSFYTSHDPIFLNLFPSTVLPHLSPEERGARWAKGQEEGFEENKGKGMHWMKACKKEDPSSTPLGFAKWQSPLFTTELYPSPSASAPTTTSPAPIAKSQAKLAVDEIMDIEFTGRFDAAIRGSRQKVFKQDEAHWYLELLAISPHHQRKSLGALLVSYGITQQSTTPRVPLYLEASEQGVGLYKKLGFTEALVVEVDVMWEYENSVGEGEGVKELEEREAHGWPGMIRR